jgi:hypothetical protein
VSDDLVQFLRARLLEDELAATDTLPPALQIGRLRGKPVLHWRITESGRGVIDEDGGTLRARDIFPAEAAHAIRHDPARVLAEVEAKRRLLEDADDFCREYDNDLTDDNSAAQRAYCWRSTIHRNLARVYRDHADFDPAWLED